MLRHSERTEEMTEAARETSAGGTGDGIRCRKGYRRNGILLWGMVILFTLLYLSLIFNDNVWTDEIFSMNLFADSFAQIIVDTAEDVHPPLYYFLGRIMRLLFGESLQVQKILTIIPMSLTLALGAGKIRRNFGDRTAFLFILFLGCLPCSMTYAVQVRMYSWALLCVTACGLAAWEILKKNRIFDWIWLAISAVAAAYLHYFAFVSVIVINGLLLLWLLFSKEERKKLVRWLIFSVLMVLAYLPWLPYMLEQVTRVEGGYWIAPITAETVWSYFTWAFGLNPLPQTTYGYLLISIAAGIGCLTGCLRRNRQPGAAEQNHSSVFLYGLFAMAVPSLTAAGGTILSLIGQPIYRDQYVFPAMGLFCLFLAIGMNRVLGDGMAWLLPEAAPDAEAEHGGKDGEVYGGKEKSAASEKGSAVRTAGMAVLLLFVLFTGAISYRDAFRDEYLATLTRQTEEFFEENFGENDLVVYNYQAYYFNYKYYFPEERLAYVRDVDLSQDFDRIWFLDTEMEWDFVPDQIIPYNLQIEYVGHFGIEDNEFDLYMVTKGVPAE